MLHPGQIIIIVVIPFIGAFLCAYSGVLASTNGHEAFQDGDLILGGMFAVHSNRHSREENSQVDACDKIYSPGVISAESMIYAVNRVNKEDILPYNITLGFDIKDTCNNVDQATRCALDFVREIKSLRKSLSNPTKNMNPLWNTTEKRVVTTRKQLSDSLIAVVGAGNSMFSTVTNSILRLYGIPQIGYASTSQELSQKRPYSTFLRTVPPDNFQAKALLKLLVQFGWKYVALISSDDSYSRSLRATFIRNALKMGVCISQDLKIPFHGTYTDIERGVIKDLINSKEKPSRIIVVFCAVKDVAKILKAVKEANMTGKIWIASDSWSRSDGLVGKYMLDSLLGTANEIKEIPGFVEYFQKRISSNPSTLTPRASGMWLKEFNETFRKHSDREPLDTKGKLCSPLDLKCSNFNLGRSGHVVESVYLVAHAIKTFCKNLGSKENCLQSIHPGGLLGHLFNTTLYFFNRTLAIDENGDPGGFYDIVNTYVPILNTTSIPSLPSPTEITLGRYDINSGTLNINKSLSFWGYSRMAVPSSICSKSCPAGTFLQYHILKSCCWKCLECPFGYVSNVSMSKTCQLCPDNHVNDSTRTRCIFVPLTYVSADNPWNILFYITSLFCFVATAITLVIFVKNRKTPVIRASDFEFSLALLLCIAVAFLIPFTKTGFQPTNLTCALAHCLFAICFVLILSLLLVKINRTVLVFKHRGKQYEKVLILKKVQLVFVLSTSFLQLVFCTLWMCLDPPKAKIINIWKNDVNLERHVSCTSSVWFFVTSGTLILLSLVRTSLAYQSRHLPENYNSAKFITFAMFTFDLVWVMTMAAYYGNPYGDSSQVIFKSFAIIISTLCILMLVLGPKVYVVLFRPELNNYRTFRKANLFYAFHSTANRRREGSVGLETLANSPQNVFMMDIQSNDKAVQTVCHSIDTETQTEPLVLDKKKQRPSLSLFRRFLRVRHLSLEERNKERGPSPNQRQDQENSDGGHSVNRENATHKSFSLPIDLTEPPTPRAVTKAVIFDSSLRDLKMPLLNPSRIELSSISEEPTKEDCTTETGSNQTRKQIDSRKITSESQPCSKDTHTDEVFPYSQILLGIATKSQHVLLPSQRTSKTELYSMQDKQETNPDCDLMDSLSQASGQKALTIPTGQQEVPQSNLEMDCSVWPWWSELKESEIN